jgi:acyl-CoA thioesterase-1
MALGAVALALAAWGTACSDGGSRRTGGRDGVASGPSASSPSTPMDDGPPPVYVAVGASETTGIGSEVPLRDAWPRVLYRTAMPENTIFVNMGIPGATVTQALAEELPMALEQKPTIVTVWLNVNDIIAGVSAADFERDLATLVHQLRRDGATRVLVANSPPLDRLPAYLACRPDPPAAGPPCRTQFQLPPPDQVNALVDEFNAATTPIVERAGAHLVDLHATGMAARRAGVEQALISNDGFHPNSGGHRAVATAFAEVLRRTGPLRPGGG